MAITSYATLKTAIEAWSHRSDLAAVVDDFIDITESRLNRELRVSQMEVRATTTASTEYLALPTDLLAIRNIQLNSNPVREILYVSPMEMDRLAQAGQETNRYTIVGDEIQLNATSSGSLEIAYYAKIPALSDAAPSNWLLAAHPEVYLYGCLAETFKYAMDDEQAAKYAGLYSEAIGQIKRLDRERKTGQSMYVRVA
jgi:hypothetical protein